MLYLWILHDPCSPNLTILIIIELRQHWNHKFSNFWLAKQYRSELQQLCIRVYSILIPQCFNFASLLREIGEICYTNNINLQNLASDRQRLNARHSHVCWFVYLYRLCLCCARFTRPETDYDETDYFNLAVGLVLFFENKFTWLRDGKKYFYERRRLLKKKFATTEMW
jgi:hypothetical protein